MNKHANKPTLGQPRPKQASLAGTFFGRLVKGIGITAIAGIIVGFFLFLLVVFGSCETAVAVAKLAPKFEYGGFTYTYDQLVRDILSLRRILRKDAGACHAEVSAEVFRFCYDEYVPSGKKGLRIIEEAFLLNVKLRSYGRPVKKLTLHLQPGVISPPPCNDGPNQEVMVEESEDFHAVYGKQPCGDESEGKKQFYLPKGWDPGAWEVDYVADDPPPWPEGSVTPIRYYALWIGTDKVNDRPPTTCEVSSQSTRIGYVVEDDDGKQPEKKFNAVTFARSWEQMADDGYFRERRMYGNIGAKNLKETMPTSGWGSFPDDYPGDHIQPPPKYDFCEKKEAQCR